MKILICGLGKMGRAIAKLSLTKKFVSNVVLVDINEKQLQESVNELSNLYRDKAVIAIPLAELEFYMDKADLILCALPWSAHKNIIGLALKYNKPLVSIARPEYDELKILQQQLKNSKVPIILGCGVEPGLTEIMALHIAEKFNKLNELHIKCGGIPLTPPHNPLHYKAMFGANYLPIGIRDVYTYSEGHLEKVPRFSGLEAFYLSKIAKLEAWNDGMVPWLCDYSTINSANIVTQKTLRWPGHANAVLMLNELDLLSEQEILIAGKPISAKKFIDYWYAADTELEPNESNVTILSIEAKGKLHDNGCDIQHHHLIIRECSQLQLNSMAWLTAYVAVYAGVAAVENSLQQSGLLYPEQLIHGAKAEVLMSKLNALSWQ